MIKFQDVSYAYEAGSDVLKDISLEIAKGESVGLIGQNGAGKSTLMKLILGLLYAEGRILVDGTEVNKENLPDIRKKAGYLLQDSDNQMFMPTVYEDMIFGPLNYMKSREETDETVDKVLSKLNIEYLKHRHNHKISGGEKKMAAIATVLAMEPEVILMDEPSSSLDPYNRRLVIDAIKDLDQTKLIASHDLDMIKETCNRVILLSEGKIVADGDADKILGDSAILREYKLSFDV